MYPSREVKKTGEWGEKLFGTPQNRLFPSFKYKHISNTGGRWLLDLYPVLWGGYNFLVFFNLFWGGFWRALFPGIDHTLADHVGVLYFFGALILGLA